jgi:Na+-transporting NADH:ubiquinone oxidoreductase subunit NqrD
LSTPLNDENPITVQVLGICSALAVTVMLEPALVLAIAVVVVMGAANVIISLQEYHTVQDKDNCAACSDSFPGYTCRPGS